MLLPAQAKREIVMPRWQDWPLRDAPRSQGAGLGQIRQVLQTRWAACAMQQLHGCHKLDMLQSQQATGKMLLHPLGWCLLPTFEAQQHPGAAIPAWNRLQRLQRHELRAVLVLCRGE